MISIMLIKTPLDFFVVAALATAFLLMLSGYLILIRQAFASSDKKRMFKQILNLPSSLDGLNPRGLQLIFAGAAIGAVLFGAFFLCVALPALFSR